MNWWRAHHGISNDSKLAVVALRSGVKKGEVLAVWVTLLDYASQNKPDRGSAAGLDAEQIAIMTDFPLVTVESALASLRERGLIQQDAFLTAWPKRQPARERDDDVSTERVRRFRDKQRHETPESGDETPRNAQRRGEESRGEEKSQNPCAADAAPGTELAVIDRARTAVEEIKQRPSAVWVDDRHDKWYKAYWNHKSRPQSKKAYERALHAIAGNYRALDSVSASRDLYERAARFLLTQVTEDRSRFEGTAEWESRVRLLPATWLNNRRWEDESTPEVHKLTVHQERHQRTLDAMKMLDRMEGIG